MASALLIALVGRAAPAVAGTQVDAAVYARAALFLRRNRENMVSNVMVRPHWRLGGKERFTYRKELGEGKAIFLEVDAATGAKKPAFDAKILAEGLSGVGGKPVDSMKLPFQDYDEVGADQIRVSVGGKDYLCGTEKPSCALANPAPDPHQILSPDGRWAAFVKDNNLWVRAVGTKESFALTTDGEPYAAYGAVTSVVPESVSLRLKGLTPPPAVIWSPDSKRIFTQRIDERKVQKITIVRSTPLNGSHRPQAYSFPYALAGDPELPMADEWVFDVQKRQGVKIKLDPLPQLYLSTIQAREAFWSSDGKKLYMFWRPRFYKTMTLSEIDPQTGAARAVVTESGKTFVEPAAIFQRPMIAVLKSGEVIWFSQRDGQGRLYIYDGASGVLERTLTKGAGEVTSILRIDEAKGVLYASISDHEPRSDPYYHKVYKIRLSDAKMTLLTPEDADHAVFALQQWYEDPVGSTSTTAGQYEDFSPSARYFIDNYSTVDLPNRAVLRRSDGSVVAEIERADVSRLEALGVTPPERFEALAADGKTKLYGAILRPTHFDPHKRYPVIDSPYPGPQSNRVSPRNLDLLFDPAQAFAELGFVVVLVDGRGTPGRGKAFQDESYGALGQAGHLDDHIAVLKALSARYPYMDLDRVGIYGSSGGGYAAARALFAYPDFFKVGVSDAGEHDVRGYIAIWAETYNGPERGENDASAANASIAKNLKGKLLLMHGDMDTNVFPDLTLQVVDALIKANKDFDLLIVPNAGHTAWSNSPYARRRAFDYMVKYLMGAEPPKEYDLAKAVGNSP